MRRHAQYGPFAQPRAHRGRFRPREVGARRHPGRRGPDGAQVDGAGAARRNDRQGARGDEITGVPVTEKSRFVLGRRFLGNDRE